MKGSYCCTYPVFPLLFKPLLEPVDLLLQNVDPLCELGRRQLLFLIVAGAKGRTPSATGEIHDIVNFTAPSRLYIIDKSQVFT